MDGKRVIEYIDSSKGLPVIQPQIMEIIKLINSKDNVNAESICDKIHMCKNLENILLENINRGYLAESKSKDIKSIKEAIVLLGMKTFERIIIAYLIKSLLPDSDGQSTKFDRRKYWKHCLGTSVAATMLADRLGIEEKYKFFSYGLIHDVGVALLDIYLPNIIDKIIQLQKKGLNQIIAEREIMKGFTHCDLGAWLCRKWNLPEDVWAIVKYHHTPNYATEYLTEVRILSVADSISTLYYERLLNFNNIYVLNEKLLPALGINMNYVKEISKKLPEKVEILEHLFNFTLIESCAV